MSNCVKEFFNSSPVDFIFDALGFSQIHEIKSTNKTMFWVNFSRNNPSKKYFFKENINYTLLTKTTRIQKKSFLTKVTLTYNTLNWHTYFVLFFTYQCVCAYVYAPTTYEPTTCTYVLKRGYRKICYLNFFLFHMFVD